MCCSRANKNCRPAVFKLKDRWAVYFLDPSRTSVTRAIRVFEAWDDAMSFALDSVIECAEGSIDSAVFRYYATAERSNLQL